jgi:hypothetical protein
LEFLLSDIFSLIINIIIRKSKKCCGYNLFPSGTAVTDAFEKGTSLYDFSPVAELGRHLSLIKSIPGEIGDGPALFTDRMVVTGHFCLKAGLTFYGLHSGNETMFFQGGQGSVHCIQGDGGQPFNNPFVEHLGRGVVCSARQFFIDFKALMGNLEISIPAGGFKFDHHR